MGRRLAFTPPTGVSPLEIAMRLRTWAADLNAFVSVLGEKPQELIDAGTTPSISGGAYFEITNAAPTSVTEFRNGRHGQNIVVSTDPNTTVVHNPAKIALPRATNLVGPIILMLHLGSDGVWRVPAIAASTIIADVLSAITADVGELTAGQIHNVADDAGILLSGVLPVGWTTYLDLTAAGTDPILHHAGLDLNADGSAVFSGDLSAAGGTFAGALSAATGTFAGDLSAAGGTFAGALSAATGTFAGSLSAATGTFAGALSAATGTFSGSLSAASVSAELDFYTLTSLTGYVASILEPVGGGGTRTGVKIGGGGLIRVFSSDVPGEAATNIEFGAVAVKVGTFDLATISFGAADSGGVGFKFMRVPN